MKKKFLTVAALASLTCGGAHAEDTIASADDNPSSTAIEETSSPESMDVSSTAQPLQAETAAGLQQPNNMPVEDETTATVPSNTADAEDEGDEEGEEDNDPSVAGVDSTEKPTQKDFFVVNDPPSEEMPDKD